jgi:hypothetical protein
MNPRLHSGHSGCDGRERGGRLKMKSLGEGSDGEKKMEKESILKS